VTKLRLALPLVLFLVGAASTSAATVQESFPGTVSITRSGTYNGDNLWTFLSTAAVSLNGSPTAFFTVANNQLTTGDPTAALAPNPNPPPPFIPLSGSISNLAYIPSIFSDQVVTANVNVNVPVGAAGSSSRQGVMARWDFAENFYWLALDFFSGSVAIEKFGNDAAFATLFESPVKGFDNKQSYKLQFTLMGSTLQGMVFDSVGNLILATGPIVDPQSIANGASGLLTEVSSNALYTPIRGSFSNFSITGAKPATLTTPEPGTLGLMLLAFGALGGRLTRRMRL
jgi:hypothetical protein